MNPLVNARVCALTRERSRERVRSHVRRRTLMCVYACMYAHARHRAVLDCGLMLPQGVGRRITETRLPTTAAKAQGDNR